MTKTLDEIAKDYLRGMYGDEPENKSVQEDYVDRVIAAYGYEPKWDANWVRSAFECGKGKSAYQWISVEEKLPEKQQFVLLCFDGRVFIGYYHKINHFKNTWFDENGYAAYPPTHWMPLPKAPNQKKSKISKR